MFHLVFLFLALASIETVGGKSGLAVLPLNKTAFRVVMEASDANSVTSWSVSTAGARGAAQTLNVQNCLTYHVTLPGRLAPVQPVTEPKNLRFLSTCAQKFLQTRRPYDCRDCVLTENTKLLPSWEKKCRSTPKCNTETDAYWGWYWSRHSSLKTRLHPFICAGKPVKLGAAVRFEPHFYHIFVGFYTDRPRYGTRYTHCYSENPSENFLSHGEIRIISIEPFEKVDPFGACDAICSGYNRFTVSTFKTVKTSGDGKLGHKCMCDWIPDNEVSTYTNVKHAHGTPKQCITPVAGDFPGAQYYATFSRGVFTDSGKDASSYIDVPEGGESLTSAVISWYRHANSTANSTLTPLNRDAFLADYPWQGDCDVLEDLKLLLDNPTEASRTKVRIEDIVKLCPPCEQPTIYACGLRSLTSRQPQAPLRKDCNLAYCNSNSAVKQEICVEKFGVQTCETEEHAASCYRHWRDHGQFKEEIRRAKINPDSCALEKRYQGQDTSLSSELSSEDIRQQTVDVLMTGFDEIGCDQLLEVTSSNAMDAAAEFSCLPTRKSTDANTCQLFGMDLVVPRTKSHWKKLLGKNDASYFTLIPGIVQTRVVNSSLSLPPFPIMSSSFVLTTENSTNGSTLPTLTWWRAIDDGDWWLRDTYLDSYPMESWDDDCENCWLVGD